MASFWALFSPCTALAQDLKVAAASDLQFVLQEVATRFEKQSGHHVQLTFGSSGNFFSQIENGAPFDLFFSADVDYPKTLEAAGLVESNSLYRYATGRIVLWVPNNSPIDLSRGLSILTAASVRKVAIANPAHAPYGRAAVAALQHEGIYETVRNKFVLGENISQAAQFVESRNADAGILALSIATAPTMKDKGCFIEIPAAFYPPIEQAAIILKSSRNKLAARQFLKFLKKPDTVALMRDYGFSIPEK